MDRSTISALLGRPLTSVEDTNFDLYLNVARHSLDDMLCSRLCDNTYTRTFAAWDGYSTVWTDIFTDVDEVRINGNVVTNYSKRQGDRRSGSWFNSLVFDKPFTCDEEVEIDAFWGFDKMPVDLQQVLAGLFGLIGKKSTHDGSIQSKQVEDFRITLKDVDLDDEFSRLYGSTIMKYSSCDKIGIKSGKVCIC